MCVCVCVWGGGEEEEEQGAPPLPPPPLAPPPPTPPPRSSSSLLAELSRRRILRWCQPLEHLFHHIIATPVPDIVINIRVIQSMRLGCL